MKKLISIAFLALVSLTGCATYSEQKWTPDGFNYTFAADHEPTLKPAQHYFGLSWNLKP